MFVSFAVPDLSVMVLYKILPSGNVSGQVFLSSGEALITTPSSPYDYGNENICIMIFVN